MYRVWSELWKGVIHSPWGGVFSLSVHESCQKQGTAFPWFTPGGSRPIIFELGLKYLPLKHLNNLTCKNRRLGKQKYIIMTEFTIKTFLTEARRHTKYNYSLAVKVSCTLGGKVFKVPPSSPSHPSKYFILWGITILFKAPRCRFWLGHYVLYWSNCNLSLILQRAISIHKTETLQVFF